MQDYISLIFSNYQLPSIKDDPTTRYGWKCGEIGTIRYVPFSGLPHLAELFIYVHPLHRRQGHGSRLLTTAVDALNKTACTQIVVCCPDKESAIYSFLSSHGFLLEHEAWTMTHMLATLQPATIALHTLPRVIGLPLFRQLYDDSFMGKPWYQAWEDDDDVDSACDNLYFLQHQGEWIGFAGVTIIDGMAQIEPLGIIKKWQGKGFGQRFVAALLHDIKRLATAASVTFWHNNETAQTIYKKQGFTYTTRSYWLTRATVNN